jgi:Helix-turn-helix domain
MTRSSFLVPLPGVAYTTPEAAVFLRLRKNTLENWRMTGGHPELRFYRLGRRVVYLGEDILAFLNAAPKLRKPKSARRANNAP